MQDSFWVYATWVYVIGEWVIRIVMTPVVMRRRTPTSTLAWLTVIYFLPWIGIFVYGLIGGTWLGAKRAQERGPIRDDVRQFASPALASAPVGNPPLDKQHLDLVELGDRISGLEITGGNAMELIADSRDFIARLCAEIDHAESTVHLLYYIFADDESGRQVIDALRRASERGVRCRVLVDAAASKDFLRRKRGHFESTDVDVAGALPVSPLRAFFERMDIRNHRKLAIIDGRVAYAGSQNLINADYGGRKVGVWRDLTARIDGPAVIQLQEVFLAGWRAETGHDGDESISFPTARTEGGCWMQVIPTGPGLATESFRNMVVASIHEANSRIIITSPYLAPDEPTLLALRLAALKGVQVDLVVPERSDQRLAGAAARAFYEDLLEAGVRIHLFRNGLLHAKTITVDDSFAMVGSGNFDIRSFLLNFELNVFVYGLEATESVRAQQLRYIKECRVLSREEWALRPRPLRFIDSLAQLFSPLL